MSGELHVLIQLHLDDALDDAQAARLRELLQEPAALDELVRAVDLHGALAARRPLPASPRRPARRAWALTAAALALAALALYVGTRPRAVVGRLEDSAGGARGSRPLLEGELVRSGNAPAAQAVVVLLDGSRVELEARTRLRVSRGKRIRLEDGGIAVLASPQRDGEALAVDTAHASVRVTGTRFSVWTSPASTRLDVQEGRVRLERPGDAASLELAAGQQARIGEGLPFVKKAAGLRGEYFDSRGDEPFAKPRETRVDPEIDFRWNARSPGFAVRWTGELQARESALHAFHLLSECGARLWIGERLLIDHWGDHDAAEAVESLALEAGRSYPLRLEYYACGGGADGEPRIRLAWSSPGRGTSTIPSRHLSPEDR